MSVRLTTKPAATKGAVTRVATARRVFGDQYEITATVVSSAVLERWLLSFGDDVSMVRRLRLVGAKSISNSQPAIN